MTKGIKTTWVVFFYGDRELCAYTYYDTFAGELQSTLELLAYENNIPVSSISYVIMTR